MDWWATYGAGFTALIVAAVKASYIAAEPGLDPMKADVLATQYARERGLALLSESGDYALPTLVKDEVRELIASGIENGWSLGELKNNIMNAYSFSPVRAALIARTETTTALGNGANAAAVDAGKAEKAWITSGQPCQYCIENEGEDWIPIDQDFSSGDPCIPAHPGCECDTIYRGEQLGGIDPTEGLADDVAAAIAGSLAEAFCPRCHKLLDKNVPPLELWCRRCKAKVVPVPYRK